MEVTVTRKRGSNRHARRRATALLVCIFAITVMTVLVVAIVDAQTLQMKALRHTQEYERALYLAGAGVHQMLATIENDPSFTAPASLGPTEFPAGCGDTYQAVVVASGSDLVITGTGTSGVCSRHLQVTITQQAP